MALTNEADNRRSTASVELNVALAGEEPAVLPLPGVPHADTLATGEVRCVGW